MRVSPFLTDLEKTNKNAVYALLGGVDTFKLIDWGTKTRIIMPDGEKQTLTFGIPTLQFS